MLKNVIERNSRSVYCRCASGIARARVACVRGAAQKMIDLWYHAHPRLQFVFADVELLPIVLARTREKKTHTSTIGSGRYCILMGAMCRDTRRENLWRKERKKKKVEEIVGTCCSTLYLTYEGVMWRAHLNEPASDARKLSTLRTK